MGVLKTIGLTTVDLRCVLLIQYGAVILAGMAVGLLLTVPVSTASSAATLTTIGIRVPAALPAGWLAVAFGAILTLLDAFIYANTRKIKKKYLLQNKSKRVEAGGCLGFPFSLAKKQQDRYNKEKEGASWRGYHADPDGTLRLNFNYVDMVLDFFTSTGAIPWVGLDCTPPELVDGERNFFGGSCMNLPGDLGRWEEVVTGLRVEYRHRHPAGE